MKTNDPASLQNLNDIVLPAATSWWPLASGWYFVFGLILLIAIWLNYQSLKRWMANRYRRAALRELEWLAESVQNPADRESSLSQLPVLLKRAALSAYPRNEVACLSGRDWHLFLNAQMKTPVFTESTCETLDNIAYSCVELSAIDAETATALLNASRQWLKHHQAASRSRPERES